MRVISTKSIAESNNAPRAIGSHGQAPKPPPAVGHGSHGQLARCASGKPGPKQHQRTIGKVDLGLYPNKLSPIFHFQCLTNCQATLCIELWYCVTFLMYALLFKDSLSNISPKVLTKVNNSRGHRLSLWASHLSIKGTGLKLIAQITAFTVLLGSVVAAKCEGGQKFAELVSINLSTIHLEPWSIIIQIKIMTFINILARTTPTFLWKEDTENRIGDKELSTQEWLVTCKIHELLASNGIINFSFCSGSFHPMKVNAPKKREIRDI